MQTIIDWTPAVLTGRRTSYLAPGHPQPSGRIQGRLGGDRTVLSQVRVIICAVNSARLGAEAIARLLDDDARPN